jgi:hypothetical protein
VSTGTSLGQLVGLVLAELSPRPQPPIRPAPTCRCLGDGPRDVRVDINTEGALGSVGIIHVECGDPIDIGESTELCGDDLPMRLTLHREPGGVSDYGTEPGVVWYELTARDLDVRTIHPPGETPAAAPSTRSP